MVTLNNLPSEILRKIFHENVLRDAFSEERIVREPFISFTTPLRISHVCRRWREESLSFGTLWSYLWINRGYMLVDNELGALKYMFDTCLERTKGCPLNFKIHWTLHFSSLKSHNVAEYMLTNMLSQQHRWRDVDFKWIALKASPDFPGIHADNLPMLSSLRLTVNFKTNTGEKVIANVKIAQLGRLGRLELLGDYILHFGDEPIRTLEGSTSDDAFALNERPAGGICLELLRITPNLEWLDVQLENGDEGSDTGAYGAHEFVSEKLRILRFRANRKAVPSIFQTLTLPALNVLHYGSHHEPIGGEVLLKFVQRSMPPLTHLAVGDDILNGESLVPTLRLLPALRELCVPFTNDPSRLFEALTLQNVVRTSQNCTDDIICPRLCKLLLEEVCLVEETDCLDTLFVMARSRWEVLGTFEIIRDGRGREIFHPNSRRDYEKVSGMFIKQGPIWICGDDPDDRHMSFDWRNAYS